MCGRGENGISLLGITGYVIVQVDGKYVMLQMLLGAAPFGDVKHTGDAILCDSKHELVGYGVGKYESYFTPASGGGIERVFFSAGKQHDALKKRTMDKTLENTLKASINMTLPTCDDKGNFTDDDDTYRKRKYPTVVGAW